MSWTDLLNGEIRYNYGVAEKLMGQVEDSQLGWKPATGSNWMTMGQLLMHITNACGMGVKGFATGDWGMPPGEMAPGDMLPPAEKLPAVSSVAEAKRLLAEDMKVALNTLSGCSEDRLSTEIATAPWDPTEMVLGHRLLQMVGHLNQHKGQLYYYLKLQGKPVNTGDLWGM